MSALTDLLAQLNANRIAAGVQPVYASIDLLEAALNLIVGGGAAVAVSNLNPVPPTSATQFTMAGMGVLITPLRTGIIAVDMYGTIQDTSNLAANTGISLQPSFGTGAAPVNNAALAGTQFGNVQTYTAPVAPGAAANVNVPFCAGGLITGLTVGQAIWIDAAQKAGTIPNQYKLTSVTVRAFEL